MYSNRGPYSAIGDVNNDGLDDIYFGASAGYEGKLYLQSADAHFSLKTTADFLADKNFEDGRSVFFDADGDQDVDLYVTSGSNEVRDSNNFKDRLYLNDGMGNFSKAEQNVPKILANTVAVQALDIDADGDQDLVVGGNVKPKEFPTAYNTYVLLNNSKGVFEKKESILPKNGKLGLVNDIRVGDLNDDQKPDLILAGDWMPIRILINNGESFDDETEEYGLGNSNGMWNTIELIDVNNDGKKDIIGGNRGTNSFFKCSEEQPATLYVNDFDENGEREGLVNYYFSDGVMYPKYSLNEVLEQLPSWRGLYSRYKKYSAATAASIFDEKYTGTESYECKRFSSTVFLRGANSFKSYTLPSKVQFSSVFGIAALPQEKGAPYILTAGNNYAVDVNTGRLDADYGFSSQWVSGFMQNAQKNILPPLIGQIRQISLVKTANNKRLILVNRNDLSPLVLLLSID
jgi:hypothetical protein